MKSKKLKFVEKKKEKLTRGTHRELYKKSNDNRQV